MPDCPNCGLGAFIVAGELGYLCTLCLHHWPYELSEPDFDFQEYRDWCETVDLKLRWAEIDFVKWLYSEGNTRANAIDRDHGRGQ